MTGAHRRRRQVTERRGYESGPRGRRKRSAADARADILRAAQALFPRFDVTEISIRDIARTAHVDPRLVLYYFRTKEELLLTAFGLRIIPMMRMVFNPEDLKAGDGARAVLGFLRFWDQGDHRRSLAGLLRMAGPGTRLSTALRSLLVEQLGRQVYPVDAPEGDAQARIELMAGQLFGLALIRYVFAWEPVASMPPEMLAPVVGPFLDLCLSATKH